MEDLLNNREADTQAGGSSGGGRAGGRKVRSASARHEASLPACLPAYWASSAVERRSRCTLRSYGRGTALALCSRHQMEWPDTQEQALLVPASWLSKETRTPRGRGWFFDWGKN